MARLDLIRTASDMERACSVLAGALLEEEPFDRGSVHAQATTTPEMVTRELRQLDMVWEVPLHQMVWAGIVGANLPWAEDHFQERVSGEPLNPPPSEAWWPFAQQGNSLHKKDEKFSHSYPERFWPRFADWDYHDGVQGLVGIRFRYGDLNDLVNILKQNPRSRQAYLPVWFPEDLAAARGNERVPCTLGYHFQLSPRNQLDMFYPMRSCDFVRFFRDDIYMAGRLLQWVAEQVELTPGELNFHTANLHCFMGDTHTLREWYLRGQTDVRASYNFGAML